MRWPLIRFMPSQTHIDFVRLAPFAAILSGLAILASCISFGVQGLNLGIDFAGGTELQVATSLFTALLITQVLIGLWFRSVRPKQLPI